MTTTYILHGGFTRLDNELNQSFFHELANRAPEQGNILLCFFASGGEDKSEVFTELRNKIQTTAGNKNLSFTLATKPDFLSQVNTADIVYLHGGDNRVLLAALAEYPDFVAALSGKVVAGSSAGAYVLVSYGAAHSETLVREGLGLVPVRVVCHFESESLPPTPESLVAIKDMTLELELVYLRDCEWRVFEL